MEHFLTREFILWTVRWPVAMPTRNQIDRGYLPALCLLPPPDRLRSFGRVASRYGASWTRTCFSTRQCCEADLATPSKGSLSCSYL